MVCELRVEYHSKELVFRNLTTIQNSLLSLLRVERFIYVHQDTFRHIVVSTYT